MFRGMADRGRPEAALDRPRLDDHDVDAGPAEFEPQRVGIALDREFRGDIGAAEGGGDEAEHRGVEDDPAVPLPPHHRDHPPGQVVPAEQVGLELGAKQRRVEILQRAGLGIGAVVEQRVEPAAGGGEHVSRPPAMLPRRRSRAAPPRSPRPPAAPGPLAARGGEDPPAAGLQVSAASRPIPEEQPVIRIVRPGGPRQWSVHAPVRLSSVPHLALALPS